METAVQEVKVKKIVGQSLRRGYFECTFPYRSLLGILVENNSSAFMQLLYFIDDAD